MVRKRKTALNKDNVQRQLPSDVIPPPKSIANRKCSKEFAGKSNNLCTRVDDHYILIHPKTASQNFLTSEEVVFKSVVQTVNENWNAVVKKHKLSEAANFVEHESTRTPSVQAPSSVDPVSVSPVEKVEQGSSMSADDLKATSVDYHDLDSLNKKQKHELLERLQDKYRRLVKENQRLGAAAKNKYGLDEL